VKVMKNILIMGIGRSGKTTLSNMIKNKYNSFNLIHSDCIKWGIIRAEGKEKYYEENVDEQKEWEHSKVFQNIILEFFNSSIRNDGGALGYLNGKNLTERNNSGIGSFGYILESGQLEPKCVSKKINFKNTIVICLGLGTLTKQDIFDLCRKNDTEMDWSYQTSDADLRKHIDKWYEMNEQLKIECPKYGIEYIDTSKNRKEVLNKILEDISNKIF